MRQPERWHQNKNPKIFYLYPEKPKNNSLQNAFKHTGSDNRYLCNGKELQTDFGLDWYDYVARFYDPQLGRFHVNGAYAEKYYDLSTYQYAANNPIVNIDINGDSIWFTTQYDKSGELSGVTMNVTGTVVDNTKGGLTEKQIEKKRGQIEKGIEKAFKGSGDNIEFNASANITVSKNDGSIKSSDHVFRLVDDVAETTGATTTPGLEVKGQATPFQNIVYLDSDLSGRSLQRTSAHELGHSGGLAHIKDATEITLGGALKSLSVTDYPKNLMHQSRDVAYPGFKIEPFQIRRIKKFYDFGLLNKGSQK